MSKKGRGRSKAPVDPTAAPVDPTAAPPVAEGAPPDGPKATDKARKRRSKPKIDKRASEPVIGERPSAPEVERPSKPAIRGEAAVEADPAESNVTTGAIVSVEAVEAISGASNVTTGSIIGVEYVVPAAAPVAAAKPAPGPVELSTASNPIAESARAISAESNTREPPTRPASEPPTRPASEPPSRPASEPPTAPRLGAVPVDGIVAPPVPTSEPPIPPAPAAEPPTPPAPAAEPPPPPVSAAEIASRPASEPPTASRPAVVPVDGIVAPPEPAKDVAPLAAESPTSAAPASEPTDAPARPSPRRLRPERSSDEHIERPDLPPPTAAPTTSATSTSAAASTTPAASTTASPSAPTPTATPAASTMASPSGPTPTTTPDDTSSGTPIEPFITTSAEAPLFTPIARAMAELPAEPELLAKAESPATALTATVAEASAPPSTAERAPSTAERAPSSAERASSTAERASSTAERASSTAERAPSNAGRASSNAERPSSHPDPEHTVVPARVGPSAAAAALEAARIVSEIVDIDTPTGAVIAAAAAAGAAIEVARADAAATGTTLEIVHDGDPPSSEGSSGDPVTTVRLSRDRILRALDEPGGLATPVPRAPTHQRAQTQPGGAGATTDATGEAPSDYDEPEFFDPVQLAAAAIQRLRQRARSDLAELRERSSRLDILVIVVALATIIAAGRLHASLVTPRSVAWPPRPQVVIDACVDKPTNATMCTSPADCASGQVCGPDHACVATCEFNYDGKHYGGTCDVPDDDPPECRPTGALSAGFPDHGLAFRHSTAWLGADALPIPPPRLVHDLALAPAQQADAAYHVELTSSVDPIARIEVLIDKKPAWSNIVTGLDLDRRSRWGELYTLDDSDVKSIEGHQWLRTEYRYAHSSEKGDVPRVDRAIEYATIDRDQIYVVTLFGSPAELDRIESVVAPTLRVATPSALPLVPQTGHLGQRTFPTEVEHAFDSTVMVVVADIVDGRLKARGGGSGIIVGADGSILTNYHVVHDKDGRLHDVFVIGRLSAPDKAPQLQCAGRPSRSKLQRELDLALIKCDLDLDGRAWNPAQSGGVWPILDPLEAKEVKAGQRLWVIGYPDVGGGGLTLYQGQVEGWTGENGTQGTDFIKTDAPISNGNSGGPVVDDRGRLVGIASAYRTKVTANGGFVQTAQVGLVRPIGAASDLLAIALAGWTPRENHTDVDLAPSAVEPAASGIHISTRVLDTSNEAPVRDALVMVLRPGVSASAVDVNRLDDQVLSWGRSNAAGDVLLKQPVPVPGNYTVMVVARGYEPLIGEGELHLDANAPANFDPWGKIWLRAR